VTAHSRKRAAAPAPSARPRPAAAAAAPLKKQRGRPRKFGVPSRAITITLPEPVIDALEAIDADLGRAIVRLAQPEMAKLPHLPAEIARFGSRAVIVVNPTRTLERRTGVTLVPLPDGRALISFARSITPAHIELKLADALDDPELDDSDRAIFTAIQDILRSVRKTRGVSVEQRSIIVLETDRRAGAAPVRSGRGAARPRRSAPVSTRTVNG
jgi:hypothetical protein